MTGSIFETLRNEGISLNETTKGARFRCPFHPDKHPSSYAYKDTNRFFCFGCGENGDSIDFIMKLKGLNFKEALGYLGIERPHEASTEKKRDEKQRTKQVLLKAFRDWEKKYYEELATTSRVFHRVAKGFRTMEEAEQFAVLYHEMPLMEDQMNVLLFRNDEQKYRLFKEICGEL